MKKKFVTALLVSLMLTFGLTACQGGSPAGAGASSEEETAQEGQEEGGEEDGAKKDEANIIYEGHEIDHPTYGKLIVSGDLWNVCLDVEKETNGEISAEKAAYVLYYEEEDSHGTEADTALQEAKDGLYGDHKDEYIQYIKDSLEMMGIE